MFKKVSEVPTNRCFPCSPSASPPTAEHHYWTDPVLGSTSGGVMQLALELPYLISRVPHDLGDPPGNLPVSLTHFINLPPFLQIYRVPEVVVVARACRKRKRPSRSRCNYFGTASSSNHGSFAVRRSALPAYRSYQYPLTPFATRINAST